MADSTPIDPQVIQLRELRKIFKNLKVLSEIIGHKGGVAHRAYTDIHMGRFINGTYPLADGLRHRIIEVYNCNLKNNVC